MNGDSEDRRDRECNKLIYARWGESGQGWRN